MTSNLDLITALSALRRLSAPLGMPPTTPGDRRGHRDPGNPFVFSRDIQQSGDLFGICRIPAIDADDVPLQSASA